MLHCIKLARLILFYIQSYSFMNFHFISRKSISRFANVCLWVCPSSKPLSLSELLLSPIDHQAYLPSSLSTINPIKNQAYRPSTLLAIEPINHQAYQSFSLLTIEPIDHQAYQPSSLLTIYRLSDLLSRLLSHFGLFFFE